MVPMARIIGTMNSMSMISVIAMTARARLFHSLACSHRSTGHVVTTTIVAQMIAARNGCNTQNDAVISATMKSTPKVMLAKPFRAIVIVQDTVAIQWGIIG